MVCCNRCHEKLPQKREVKLKDNSIVCNKCACRVIKEYHKKRYKKYLNGEISYEELDPAGERPIDDEILNKFLEIPCMRCLESIGEYSNEEGFGESSAVFYDKCQGKKCPDCGKIRQQTNIEMKVFKNGFLGYMVICPSCQKEVGYEVNGVCWDCFWNHEEKKGCICIAKHGKFWRYHCSLCKEEHILDFKCEKCAELIKERSIVPSRKKIVLSVFGGFALLGVIITFLVTRRVFKKT